MCVDTYCVKTYTIKHILLYSYNRWGPIKVIILMPEQVLGKGHKQIVFHNGGGRN